RGLHGAGGHRRRHQHLVRRHADDRKDQLVREVSTGRRERQRARQAIAAFLMPLKCAATIPEVKSIIVGISGASGVIYAQRLLMQLEASPEVRQINLVISGPARRVMADELDIAATADTEQMVAELIGRP